jgi:fatty acid desaturase
MSGEVALNIESPDGANSIQAHKTPRLPARFRVKSDKYGAWLTIKTVLPLLVTVGFCSIALEGSIFDVFLAALLFGWSGYRTQFVLHDTCHMSLFSSRKVNDIVGYSVGLLVGNFFYRYRAIHFLHHRYNGLIEDPQLPDYLSETTMSRSGFVRFLFEPLWGARLLPYLKRDLLEARVVNAKIPRPNPRWWISLFIVQFTLIALMTNFFHNPFLILSFYGGMATISLFLSRLRTLAEHQQVSSAYSDFSRTHPKNWLDTLLLQDANFCYHLEHHLYPSVQSRHLPDLLKELTSDLHTKDSMGSSMTRTLAATFLKLS